MVKRLSAWVRFRRRRRVWTAACVLAALVALALTYDFLHTAFFVAWI